MALQHSPEPWKLGRCFDANCIGGATDEADDVYGTDQEISIENLERIVACVNACRHVSNEDLTGRWFEFVGVKLGQPIYRLSRIG